MVFRWQQKGVGLKGRDGMGENDGLLRKSSLFYQGTGGETFLLTVKKNHQTYTVERGEERRNENIISHTAMSREKGTSR